MTIAHNSILLLGAVSASVSVLVVVLAFTLAKLRTVRVRRRRLEQADRIEMATTAAAAIDAAAASLKKMIEAVPGTSSAFTGRSATNAIETTSQAILAILGDLPVRVQAAEQRIRKLDAGEQEMRELFNRLGK